MLVNEYLQELYEKLLGLECLVSNVTVSVADGSRREFGLPRGKPYVGYGLVCADISFDLLVKTDKIPSTAFDNSEWSIRVVSMQKNTYAPPGWQGHSYHAKLLYGKETVQFMRILASTFTFKESK